VVPILADLLKLLELERIEDRIFRGESRDLGGARVFGGQVLGQALTAASYTVRDRSVHSLHAYFLVAGDVDAPIVYEVDVARDGKSFSNRRVVAIQHGQPIFNMTASFQVPEQGLEHQDAMPSTPPPEECPELGDVLAKLSGRPRSDWDREWAALDVRYAGTPRGSVDERRDPVTRVWLRAADALADDPVLHAAVLTYASDLTLLSAAVVPHDTYIGDPRLQPASLDHAMWFHRPFRVDEWLLYDQVSPSASGGRGFATGRLFSADGRLVASAVQEGMLRLRR
jgi:acyl-CoA thioesterase-2